jgi:hypothetical protein
MNLQSFLLLSIVGRHPLVRKGLAVVAVAVSLSTIEFIVSQKKQNETKIIMETMAQEMRSLMSETACYSDGDCRNGGRCRLKENVNDFLQPLPSGSAGLCTCASGYTGAFCTIQTSAESSSGRHHASSCRVDGDCYNGGMCLVTASGKRNEDRHDFLQPSGIVETHCACAYGYRGKFCELRDYSQSLNLGDQQQETTKSLSAGSITGIVIAVIVMAIGTLMWILIKKKKNGTTHANYNSQEGRNRHATTDDGIQLVPSSAGTGLRQRSSNLKQQPDVVFHAPTSTTMSVDMEIAARPSVPVMI